MIIEISGHSTDDDTKKGFKEIGGLNELLKIFWFLFYFTGLIHHFKFYVAKIKQSFEIKLINTTNIIFNVEKHPEN